MPTGVVLAACAIALPFAGAVAIALARAASRRRDPSGALAVLASLATAAVVGTLWLGVSEPVGSRIEWEPGPGIGVGLHIDALREFFAVLLAGVGLLTTLYAVAYVPRCREGRGRSSSPATCYAYLLCFQGSMLGLVFSANLLQFYVFWELLDLVAFLLVGLNWRSAVSRQNAVFVLLFTTGGGLALLVGLAMLGTAAGSFWIPEVLARRAVIEASPLFVPALLLVAAGAVAKSAQFPLHVWLPRAMSAPTPANAVDDAVLVPASGAFLLILVHPVFAGHPAWAAVLVTVGFATVLVSGVLAAGEHDLKVLLAYSTSGQFGFVFVLLGYGGDAALAVALFFVFHHAILKSGLFFTVGTVAYATGQRQVDGPGLSPRRAPLLFGAGCVLAMSLAGLPPLGGFWSKEHFLAKTVDAAGPGLAALAVLGGALTLVYMLRWLYGLFSGRRSESGGEPPRPLPLGLVIPPTVLASLSLVLGLAPDAAGKALVDPAAAAAGSVATVESHLRLDVAMALSMGALALGALGFLALRSRTDAAARLAATLNLVERGYSRFAAAIAGAGHGVLRLQNGHLLRYASLTLLTLVGLALIGLLHAPGATKLPGPSAAAMDWRMAGLLLLVCAGTLLTFFVREHLPIVLLLGAVGYLMAGVFALALAPNLGLLQVHVETLVTVLLVLPLAAIPRELRQRLFLGSRERVTPGRLALAGAMAVGTTWISWLAIEHLPADPIAPWYGERAPELLGAADIVAAVLIEFRALDTFGEIVVFATAAVGVLVLGHLIQREKR